MSRIFMMNQFIRLNSVFSSERKISNNQCSNFKILNDHHKYLYVCITSKQKFYFILQAIFSQKKNKNKIKSNERVDIAAPLLAQYIFCFYWNIFKLQNKSFQVEVKIYKSLQVAGVEYQGVYVRRKIHLFHLRSTDNPLLNRG